MFKRNSIKILSSLAVAGVLLTACSKTPSTEQQVMLKQTIL